MPGHSRGRRPVHARAPQSCIIPVRPQLTYLPPRVVYREFPKEGIYREKIRQILSTPFRPKIDQNGLKTTLNAVGRASRGIVQPVAPSSSNMSPWGFTSLGSARLNSAQLASARLGPARPSSAWPGPGQPGPPSLGSAHIPSTTGGISGVPQRMDI